MSVAMEPTFLVVRCVFWRFRMAILASMLIASGSGCARLERFQRSDAPTPPPLIGARTEPSDEAPALASHDLGRPDEDDSYAQWLTERTPTLHPEGGPKPPGDSIVRSTAPPSGPGDSRTPVRVALEPPVQVPPIHVEIDPIDPKPIVRPIDPLVVNLPTVGEAPRVRREGPRNWPRSAASSRTQAGGFSRSITIRS